MRWTDHGGAQELEVDVARAAARAAATGDRAAGRTKGGPGRSTVTVVFRTW